LAIIPKKLQEDEGNIYILTKIQKLLDEFANIIFDDMQMGIPPMRSISH
jgi:hypothetical protein